VELHVHTPIRLHSMVLNKAQDTSSWRSISLSTGTILTLLTHNLFRCSVSSPSIYIFKFKTIALFYGHLYYSYGLKVKLSLCFF
jgi:hypothetical protein